MSMVSWISSGDSAKEFVADRCVADGPRVTGSQAATIAAVHENLMSVV